MTTNNSFNNLVTVTLEDGTTIQGTPMYFADDVLGTPGDFGSDDAE